MFKKMNDIRKSENGFTMGEVLVASSIFGILATIAIPAAINKFEDDKNFSVETNTIAAITSINEYAYENAGNMPNSLGDTNYENWDNDAKVNAVIKDGNVCLTGWNTNGGDYTVETPYTVFNGVEVTECIFPAPVVEVYVSPSVIEPAVVETDNTPDNVKADKVKKDKKKK